jgi:hypothetical protein
VTLSSTDKSIDLTASFEEITPLFLKIMTYDFRNRRLFRIEQNWLSLIGRCALWTCIAYLPGFLWWPLEHALPTTENVLGFIFDLCMIFVSLCLTTVIYIEARDKLPEMFKHLNCKLTKSPIDPSDRWKEIGGLAFFALVAAALAILAFNRNFGSTREAQVMGFLTSFAIGAVVGSWACFFIYVFIIMARIVNHGDCYLNPLAPGATIGLRILFRFATRIMATSMLILTLPLAIGLLYIQQSKAISPFEILISYLVIVAVIWSILVIPFTRLLNTIVNLIRKTRNQTLYELHGNVSQRYRELKDLTGKVDQSPRLIELKNLLELMNTVESGSLLPIDLRGISRLLLTLGVPLLPIIITYLFPSP